MTTDPMREYGRAALACVVAPLVGEPRLVALALQARREARAVVVAALPWWARP